MARTPSRPPAVAALQQAVALLGEGQPELALKAARKGLALAPRNGELLNAAAASAMRLGDYAEAEQRWRMALELSPPPAQRPYLLMNLGTLLVECGRWAEAQAQYRAALALAPDLAQLHFNLGALLTRLGRDAEAEACYRRCLELEPSQRTARFNLGTTLKRLNRNDEAAECYRALLASSPSHVPALCNLGALHQEAGDHEEAERLLLRAVEREPRTAVAQLNLGRLYLEQRRYADAERPIRRAAALDAGSVEALISLAEVLGCQRPGNEEALRHLNRAAALEPSNAEVQLARARLLLLFGRAEESERVLVETSARLAPPEPPFSTHTDSTHYDLACGLLMYGRLAEAWPHYEARHAARYGGRPPPAIAAPAWAGESLEGRSLLVWPEQGRGDTIQFCRLLEQLKARGAGHITLACRPEVLPLMHGLVGADAVRSVDDPATREQPYDYWSYLLSLPRHLGITLDSLPARLPYLAPDSERLAQWQAQLPTRRPRVGLVWKGSATHLNDRARSLGGLADLAPLWQVTGLDFVSLQKGEGEDEAAQAPPEQPLLHLGSAIRDFSDSAALLAQLDLLICVDTAVAHLAGALGRPCWVLLPQHRSDWRWLLEREDSPWYPGVMRLFRQGQDRRWEPVVARVAEALGRWKQAWHSAHAGSD